MKQSINFFLLFFGIGFSLNAQTDSYSEVYKILKANDSLIFERSFNHCELQHLDQLIPEDFEFYHDKGGLIDSKETFINGMKNGICNPSNTTKSTRELVEGSLEVFLLKNNGKLYGALQNGIHKFFETTNGNKVAGSIAKFSHLWILENDKWVLKRVISYDHNMQEQPAIKSVEVPETILNTYTGNYLAKNTGLVIITKAEKGLHLNANGMNADIYATSSTIFAHKQAPLSFEFISNEKGEIVKFLVIENGKIVEEAIKQ
jgi:hypothetical protein|nr:nuclear transport factor 2 family protein [uncultured Psychroserpens sp.]